MDVTLSSSQRGSEVEPTIALLARRARQGDHQSLELLIDQVYPLVFRFLTQLSHDPDLASDLTQESLISASRGLHALDDVNTFMPWLYRIARNTFYSSYRKHKLRAWLSLDWLIMQAGNDHLCVDPHSSIDAWDEGEVVHHVLAQLSLSSREVLYLRHLAGYSGPEIAVILDISHSAVKQRIHRAEGDFRRRYEAMSLEVVSRPRGSNA